MAPTSTYTPSSRLLRKREAARIRQRRCRQRKREAALTQKVERPDENIAHVKRLSSSKRSDSYSEKTHTRVLSCSSNSLDSASLHAQKSQQLHHQHQETHRSYGPPNMTYPPSLPPVHPHYHQHDPQPRSYYQPTTSAWEPYHPPPHHMQCPPHYPPTHAQSGGMYQNGTSTQYQQHHHPQASSYGQPPPSHVVIPMNGPCNRQQQQQQYPQQQYVNPQQHQSYGMGYNENHVMGHGGHGYYIPQPSIYQTQDSRTISRSPSASSLETPVTKKDYNIGYRSDNRSHTSSKATLPMNGTRISETAVKRKSNKSLLSTEKAAVVAMLTLKNNSSDDSSDDSTVTSNGTSHLLMNGNDMMSNYEHHNINHDTLDSYHRHHHHHTQPIVFSLPDVSNSITAV